LHGFIDGAGSVAAQVSPMMSGMMIKSMIGAQLGDPGLAGIAPGKGLAVVMLDQNNSFAVIEAGEAQIAAYSNALAARGIAAKAVEGVLVVAKSPGQVEKGSALVSVVKDKLLFHRSPDLRLTLQPAALIEKNDAQIQGMLQMMPMMMGMGMQQAPGMDMNSIQSMARILEAEVRILLSLAGQCDTAEIVLAPKDGSLVISKTFVAEEGTHLSTLLNAPKTTVPNPKIQSGLLGDAAVAVDAAMGNPEAVADFFVAETEELMKEMNLQDIDVAAIVASLKKWMNVYSGSFCETVDFGGESGFSVNYAMVLKDEAAALSLFRTMQEDMGPFIRMYENMGMPMTLEFRENVREHRGVNIHQFRVAMSLNHLPEEQRSQMEQMNLTNIVYDVAIVNGCMLYSMGAPKMETLIDRIMDDAFTASPLKARGVYPAGAFYYCDFDVAAYLSFAASMMPQVPDNPLPQIAALLQGSDPVTSAGFSEDGAVMWSVNIPGGLIGKVGQAAMMIQMRQMQQGAAPQPVIEDINVPAP
ncbi:MAG TPA: hypothetical protein VLL07_04800, partial [Pontiella sp.]|nr:hypothetical protein [Pontiella sp.]